MHWRINFQIGLVIWRIIYAKTVIPFCCSNRVFQHYEKKNFGNTVGFLNLI